MKMFKVHIPMVSINGIPCYCTTVKDIRFSLFIVSLVSIKDRTIMKSIIDSLLLN